MQLDGILNSIRRLHQGIEAADVRIRKFDTEIRQGKHPLETAFIGAEKALERADRKFKEVKCSTCGPTSTQQEPNATTLSAYEALHKLADESMESLRREGLKPQDYGVTLVSVSQLAQALKMDLQSDKFASVVAGLMQRNLAKGIPAREVALSININLEANRLWRTTDRAGAGTRVKYLEYIPSKEVGITAQTSVQKETAVKSLPQEQESGKVDVVTDADTWTYQQELLLDDLQHLETEHLPQQGRIKGKICDCVAKGARDLRRHALETIPIASRQGKDASLFSEMAKWADEMMKIGTVEAVQSGKYDQRYLAEAGAASKFRKELSKV